MKETKETFVTRIKNDAKELARLFSEKSKALVGPALLTAIVVFPVGFLFISLKATKTCDEIIDSYGSYPMVYTAEITKEDFENKSFSWVGSDCPSYAAGTLSDVCCAAITEAGYIVEDGFVYHYHGNGSPLYLWTDGQKYYLTRVHETPKGESALHGQCFCLACWENYSKMHAWYDEDGDIVMRF